MVGEWQKYKQLIVNVLARDEYNLRRRLSDIEKLAHSNKPYEAMLEKWQAQVAKSQSAVIHRQQLIPSTIEFPDLPV